MYKNNYEKLTICQKERLFWINFSSEEIKFFKDLQFKSPTLINCEINKIESAELNELRFTKHLDH